MSPRNPPRPAKPRARKRVCSDTQPPPSPRRKSPPSPPPRSQSPESDEDRSVLSLIRDIQSGAIRPETISIASRRAIVEHLTADGFSVPEIAQVLHCSDRNIARDRAALRAAHSVEMTPELTQQMVGHMLREAEIGVNRLRRFVRSNDIEAAVKIEAEKASWTITREMIQMLQRLGYLPNAPSTIQGHLIHQSGDGLPDPNDLHREIVRIERILLEDPVAAKDADALRLIKRVKSTARALGKERAGQQEPSKP